MIKFFRKIRYNFMETGKTGKYFKYAIGEIFLVMIGILLALQVNNWNETRTNEERFMKILKEVRNDLEVDIDRSIRVLERGKEMDSLVNLVLDENLTTEDYLKEENRNLFWVGLQFSPFDYQKTAFNKFEGFNNVIPQKYETIISSINNHYNATGKLYDDLYQIFREQIKDRHDYLANNQNWYYLLRMQQTTDEMIDFFLNDPKYKNWIVQHQVDNTASDKYGVLKDLQSSAFGLANEISDILNDSFKFKNDKLYKKFGEPLTQASDWIGKYEEEDKDVVIIKNKNGYLFLNQYLLKLVSKDTLFFDSRYFNSRLVADRDNGGQINGYKFINLKDSTHNEYVKKIEDD
ncbi:DUF6090 family protein [Gaetbulibacter sp. S0825]|uniref:DUF6090 family protein n=1 Tax=Gaetbulibacter sp. S0825 TaxID=2720084 RepID=UPI001430C925|nr:DUF6090 family protein [Gaetbulibacter sp. S0825]